MYIVNEKIVESDENIPIKAHINNSNMDSISADSHFHSEVELVYIIEGSLKYYCEGETFTANQGNLIIFNEMVEHSCKAEGYISIALLQFRLSFIKEICKDGWTHFEDLFSKDFNYLRCDTTKSKRTKNAAQLMLLLAEELNNKAVAYEISVISNLLNIFTNIFRSEIILSANKRSSKLSPVANSIIQYIEDNYNKDLTLNEVSKHLHFSVSYFEHTFKEITGTSFINYLNSYRINIAKKLLMNNKNSITSAMIQVGITNQSYFNRLFKRYVGFTPTQFRNNFINSQKYKKSDW